MDENKIQYRRHSSSGRGWGNLWDDDSDDSDEDDMDIHNKHGDCPTCFTEMSDEGITQEFGNRSKHHSNYRSGGHYRDYFDGLDQNMHHHRKDGVGESIMSDQPIRSHSGRGGRGNRGFSFDFDDLRNSPTARHFETKGHR